MEKGSDGLREQLLARLPKSENIAAYRESTEALLAKHERAVFWERVTGRTVTWLGIAVVMFANSAWVVQGSTAMEPYSLTPSR
jgi:hypothetical protein